MVRKLAWGSMTLAAIFVGAYAAGLLVMPSIRPTFVTNLIGTAPIALVVHLAGGFFAIVLGAFQLNGRLRRRFLPAHRWFGRIYVVAVTVSGIAGLSLAINSTGGLVAHFGFGMMAVVWVWSTLAAYIQIRSGNISSHRDWMIRSYAITLAAVTLRIYMPLGMMNGIGFESIYPTVSWLCWVPNLVIVEWFILPRLNPAPRASSATE